VQPILSEIISSNQTAFILTRYILDNILLLHESIAWAEESDQSSILLKLDFKKAYDTIHLPFLFKVMKIMGIPTNFLALVKILFVDSETSVSINGSDTDSFSVLRDV